MKRIFLLAFVGLFVFSCSSNSDKDGGKDKKAKAAKLPKIEQSVRFKRVWSASVGSSVDKRFSNIQPGLGDEQVFLASVNGAIAAFGLEKGRRLWRSNIESDISAGIGYSDSKVFVGTFAGEVFAIDATNGEVLWSAQLTSEILSVPAAANGVVVAQTIDGRLFGLDAESGEQRWRYDHTVPSLTLRSTASPVIYRDQVYTAFGNGQVVCLDLAEGSLEWDARVSRPIGRNELEKIIDIDGSPVIDAGFVYAASNNGAVVSFARTQGRPIWKQDLSSYLPLALGNNHIFAVSNDAHVVAYNAVNGDIAWVNEELDLRELGAPTAFENYVLTIDSDDFLHVLDQNDGRFVARFKPSGDDFISPIHVKNDRFYVLSGNGSLSVYETQSK